MNKKILITIPLLFLLTGCVSGGLNNYRNTCETPVERDLTISYEDRAYWCAPKPFIEELPHKVPREQKATKQGNFSFRYSKESTLTNELSKSAKPGFAVTGKIKEIAFFKGDFSYDEQAIQSLSTVQEPLKLRGCRISNESTDYILGRPLRVKQELIKLGFSHKITILSDRSCIGKSVVEVR